MERLEASGLRFSGMSPDRRLMEIMELPRSVHPFFMGTQFHPELKSRPLTPHPLFKVEGRDLKLDFPITLYEAVLGAKVRLPTLDGAVEMSIPAGTSSGRILRLRGKGLPGAGEAPQGDLLATLRIALPPGEDAALNELMKQWRDKKPYDPRSGRG